MGTEQDIEIQPRHCPLLRRWDPQAPIQTNGSDGTHYVRQGGLFGRGPRWGPYTSRSARGAVEQTEDKTRRAPRPPGMPFVRTGPIAAGSFTRS